MLETEEKDLQKELKSASEKWGTLEDLSKLLRPPYCCMGPVACFSHTSVNEFIYL